MKPASFDSNPQFQQYRDMIRTLIAVPKSEVDELVKQAKESSIRNNNPQALGRKSVKLVKRAKQ
jgi:hypothetical protein